MNILKKLRQQRGLLQKDIANVIGVDRTTYLRYENGVTEPDFIIAGKLADFYGISIDDLLGRAPSGRWVNVYGKVSAGIPISAIEEIIDQEEITEDMSRNGEHIGLQISGQSMEPRIKEGDVVIVRLQPDVEDGEIAVVMINGNEATCKKIKKTPEGITLISFNPMYEPMFFSNSEIESLPVRILGKVVELRAKF